MRTGFIDAEWPGPGHRTQRWPHKNIQGDINPPPLFQMIAASILRAAGFEARLWDAPAQGLSNSTLINQLISFKADLAVINSTTPSWDHDLKFINELVERNFDGKILLVGPHATVLHKEILSEHKYIDFIALGEYDYVPRNLCANNLDPNSIPGLVFRKNQSSIEINEPEIIDDLDQLPYADYDCVNLDSYNEFLFPPSLKPIATISTSRGCSNACSFCLYPQIMSGKKVRKRSAGNIFEEIQTLIKSYKIQFLYFDDDSFLTDPQRIHELCDLFIRNNIKLSWACMARAEEISTDLLTVMKKAGCYLIKIGVESGNQSLLDFMHKKSNLSQVYNAFRLTDKAGILSHATVMFGFPGETEESINTTHQFLKELKPDFVQFSQCIPFPGTSLYKQCQREGSLSYDSWEDFDGAWGGVLSTEHLTSDDLRYAVMIGYKKYYLSFHYLLRRIYRSVFGPLRFSQWQLNAGLLARFFRRYIKKYSRESIYSLPEKK